MIKTLNNALKQDKEKYQVPKKVQDMIPVRTIYPDGIFVSGKNKYSKTFRFRDINYAVASRADKEMMFLEYSELLNSFDSGATTKITINNRRLNRLDFENQILMDMKDDELNEYREEYNRILLEKAKNLFLLFPSRSSRISPISFRVLYTPSMLLVMTISSIRHLLIYCCKAIFGRRAESLAISLSNLGY